MKKIGILGTGMVGHTIGIRLIQEGYEVKMGSRTAGNEKAVAWTKAAGGKSSEGTFADAASFGEIIFNCTKGNISLDALRLAGASFLKGKILVDVANPLEFTKDQPPFLTPSLSNTTSLGEEIQKAFPDTRVVKTLNTMNCNLMVNASRVPGDHDVFIAGNHPEAKEEVAGILKKDFGWKIVTDLGDITASRGTEMILPLWIRLWGVFKSPDFNFKIVRG